MPPARELPPAVNNADAGRFELAIDGTTAVLTYRRHGQRLVLKHTEVPEALSGSGIGAALVRAVLVLAAEENLTVVPRCPFANAWLRAHPDEAQQIVIDWPDPELQQ